jgi:hypothetical protein
MKILALSALLLIGKGIPLFGQSYIIKVSQLDSLLWMAQKSKTCDSALNFALETIKAKDALVEGQGKLIDLRGKEVATLKELDANWELRLDNTNKAFLIQKSELKQKVRRKNKVILAESGLIGLLLLILLL